MNESPQDAWFFTREGERLGPVPFADLQAKARDGGLNPRIDMVWTQGMDGWKPAGEISDLFEKRANPEPPEASSTPPDPYESPQAAGAGGLTSPECGWPGARRRGFIFMTMIFPVLWNLGFAFAAAFLIQQLGPEIMAVVAIIAPLLPLVIAVFFGINRLANLGMSRWWYLGNFVPFLNFWIAYRCFVCPAGYAYHRKLDGAGVALAVIFWLFVLLMLVAIAGLVAAVFGMIDNPAIQQQIEEIMRSAREGASKS